ncbi:MAG: hypothetical protein R3C17_03210 [Planctomycetaceae bacterium]
MFCSQCGVKASGRFCHSCGNPLVRAESESASATEDNACVAYSPRNWEQDPLYENIIRVESVRSVIAQHAAMAPKGISGEAILAVYGKVIQSPIPLDRLAAVVQPMYASWGIRTGKGRTHLMRIPIGRAIARTLCSLAKHGQTLQNVVQHEDGCVVHADLPSSICALKGILTISLQRCEGGTQIEASTDIPGQLFDWGKSNRCLEQLFNDLRTELGLPPGNSQRRVA